jgi:hypothetical protein
MVKKINFLVLLCLLVSATFSCKKDNDPAKDKKYLIKTIQINQDTIEYFRYEFTYDNTTSKITAVTAYFGGGSSISIMNYDYSLPGKLTLKLDGDYLWREFELNDIGFVTKDDKSKVWFKLWLDYSYDANGYLIKMINNSDSIVLESMVVNGNKTSQINYGITSGAELTNEIVRIAEFSFTDIDNVNNIDQFYFLNPDYRVYAGLFGKTNKKLVDHIEYWDPRYANPVKSKITFSYTFDDKNRVSKVVRLSTYKETYTYTYYE